MNDLAVCPVDALRDGAHRLLGPFSCLTSESHSPLLRGPQPMEEGDNTDMPSTSQTLPLKVIPCLSAAALWGYTCLLALQAFIFGAGPAQPAHPYLCCCCGFHCTH